MFDIKFWIYYWKNSDWPSRIRLILVPIMFIVLIGELIILALVIRLYFQ